MAGQAVRHDEDLAQIIRRKFGVHPENAISLIAKGYVALDGRVIGIDERRKPREQLTGVMLRVARRGETRLFGSARAPVEDPQLVLGATP